MSDYCTLAVMNPFQSPVLYVPETTSTMIYARKLAEEGYPSGTIIRTDRQTAGKGRMPLRSWESPVRESLLCTIILRMPVPTGFTLRVGLAVAQTIDTFLPSAFTTKIKWPNDILSWSSNPKHADQSGKKIAGILCEAEGSFGSPHSVLYAGVGINLFQTRFPTSISHKATSIALLNQTPPSCDEVMERYLHFLHESLDVASWQKSISEKLVYRGETILFQAGDPEHKTDIEGIIEGIGPSGELIVSPTEQSKSKAEEVGIRCDDTGLLHLWSGEIPYPE